MKASWVSRKIVALAVTVAAGLAVGTEVRAQGAWVAPPESKNVKNPVAKSDAVVASAKKLFEVNCVACHGAKGMGDGPAAASLPVKPANWTSAATQGMTDGEIFWKITNGRGPMPPWKHIAEKDRWAFVHFIRTFKK
jgi:mono/diheme cytochrome c family protein